ncbi:MAG TPA: TIGR02186 family protein [Novosphingobium sp.]|nr:TIGR02186 family protein [Novosphingobium sp.]
MRALFALVCLLLLSGQRAPVLVPEVSQHEVVVRQGFTGADLLLFGAILTPEGARAGRDYDIVVVLRGPNQSIVVREKAKVAGVWINADSTEFRSAPSFFAVASSAPLDRIVGEKTAAIYELGLKWMQLSPAGTIDPAEQARFSAGLVDLNTRGGLYKQAEGAVSVKEQVLYQARISLPSNVLTGTYTAETFALYRGRVVATATSRVEVRKLGFEGAVAAFAEDHGFFYGLATILVACFMGWLAGRVFALV